MKLLHIRQVTDGSYLKQYELTYLNKKGHEKVYEMVSRERLMRPTDIARRASGVSVAAFQNGKLLLLREFRMSLNKPVYNLCAGMFEKGESVEECIVRELYEETGLSVKNILRILPPAYSAVGISDTKTYLAFVETEGILAKQQASDNEEIKAEFFGREELGVLLEREEFSDRAQLAAYFFEKGCVFV